MIGTDRTFLLPGWGLRTAPIQEAIFPADYAAFSCPWCTAYRRVTHQYPSQASQFASPGHDSRSGNIPNCENPACFSRSDEEALDAWSRYQTGEGLKEAKRRAKEQDLEDRQAAIMEQAAIPFITYREACEKPGVVLLKIPYNIGNAETIMLDVPALWVSSCGNFAAHYYCNQLLGIDDCPGLYTNEVILVHVPTGRKVESWKTWRTRYKDPAHPAKKLAKQILAALPDVDWAGKQLVLSLDEKATCKDLILEAMATGMRAAKGKR